MVRSGWVFHLALCTARGMSSYVGNAPRQRSIGTLLQDEDIWRALDDVVVADAAEALMPLWYLIGWRHPVCG